jgi:hypothetical protein
MAKKAVKVDNPTKCGIRVQKGGHVHTTEKCLTRCPVFVFLSDLSAGLSSFSHAGR